VKAPFPWFGGKSSIADVIWSRFGDCPNFVDPFCGSLAVLLSRPDSHEWWTRIETVNDADGLLSNFWRAVAHDPGAVADAADWPVNECDLHARHLWLVGQRDRITERLMADAEWYDAKAAGWWCWGLCQWIGSGWCSGEGPWQADDGELTNTRDLGSAGQGVNRKLPHLGNAGRGVNRKLPHCDIWTEHLHAIMGELRDRLRRVRVCCGDWSRVCGLTPTLKLGGTAVLLDPPYCSEDRAAVYGKTESFDVAHDVREWAIARGGEPDLRIALCGYSGEHDMPDGWTCHKWKARGGYESQAKDGASLNCARERIWFSPNCLPEIRQLTLWETAADPSIEEPPRP
jgi:hypothetical protein